MISVISINIFQDRAITELSLSDEAFFEWIGVKSILNLCWIINNSFSELRLRRFLYIGWIHKSFLPELVKKIPSQPGL